MKKTRSLLGAGLLLTFLIAPVHGATLYKWVDANGNITYQDTPPPDSVNYETNEIDAPPQPISGVDGSTMDEASLANPVSLYSVPACDGCDLVRLFLESNAIPFVEKNIRNDPDLQRELEGKAGALRVPTLVIGDRILDGFSRAAISSALNQAGFPIADGSQVVAPAEVSETAGDASAGESEPLNIENESGSESSANNAVTAS